MVIAMNKKYMTIPELAKLLGVSREAVYKRVKKGEIPAIRAGKAYLISDPDAQRILGKRMTKKDKAQIEIAVQKTVYDYGDMLKWLSKE